MLCGFSRPDRSSQQIEPAFGPARQPNSVPSIKTFRVFLSIKFFFPAIVALTDIVVGDYRDCYHSRYASTVLVSLLLLHLPYPEQDSTSVVFLVGLPGYSRRPPFIGGRYVIMTARCCSYLRLESTESRSLLFFLSRELPIVLSAPFK